MIIFDNFNTTDRVLKQINYCINDMVETEVFVLGIYDEPQYIENYFPGYLCEACPEECSKILMELVKWTKDAFLHELTILHKYAIFRIFTSYFECFDDAERDRKKYERNPYKFKIKMHEDYTEAERIIVRQLNDRDFYKVDLFEDWDFLLIEDIEYLCKACFPQSNFISEDIGNYCNSFQDETRSEVEKENDLDEKFIINSINHAIKRRERDPHRLLKISEDELSDDIADIIAFSLEPKGFFVEREARGGYSNKKVGENDFCIYKYENGFKNQLAIGENKIWNNFEKQVKQLIGYMNENMHFGFTIVFNKTQNCESVRRNMMDVLLKIQLEGKAQIIEIIDKEEIIISVHIHPENNRQYKIYHLIANAYHPERKAFAKEARK